MLAMQYVLDRKPELESLILASSPASSPRWTRDCIELLAGLPAEVQDTIRRHEAHRYTGCLEYAAAILPFYKRHVCRMDPWPDGLERSFAGANLEIYEYMAGPSEFAIVGTLKDWDVTDRLGEIAVPTLIVCGYYDECTIDVHRVMADRIPDNELVIFGNSSHLTILEKEGDAYLDVIGGFLRRVDGRPRVG
jgi:proline-specific peptidase